MAPLPNCGERFICSRTAAARILCGRSNMPLLVQSGKQQQNEMPQNGRHFLTPRKLCWQKGLHQPAGTAWSGDCCTRQCGGGHSASGEGVFQCRERVEQEWIGPGKGCWDSRAGFRYILTPVPVLPVLPGLIQLCCSYIADPDLSNPIGQAGA